MSTSKRTKPLSTISDVQSVDVNQVKEKMLRALNQARSTLSGDEREKKYDEALKNFKRYLVSNKFVSSTEQLQDHRIVFQLNQAFMKWIETNEPSYFSGGPTSQPPPTPVEAGKSAPLTKEDVLPDAGGDSILDKESAPSPSSQSDDEFNDSELEGIEEESVTTASTPSPQASPTKDAKKRGLPSTPPSDLSEEEEKEKESPPKFKRKLAFTKTKDVSDEATEEQEDQGGLKGRRERDDAEMKEAEIQDIFATGEDEDTMMRDADEEIDKLLSAPPTPQQQPQPKTLGVKIAPLATAALSLAPQKRARVILSPIEKEDDEQLLINQLQGDQTAFEDGLNILSDQFDVLKIDAKPEDLDAPIIAATAITTTPTEIPTQVNNQPSVMMILANLAQFPRTIIEDPTLSYTTELYNIDPYFIKIFSALSPRQKLQFLHHSNIIETFAEDMKEYQKGSCAPIVSSQNYNNVISSFSAKPPTTDTELLQDILASGDFFFVPIDADKIAQHVEQFVKQYYATSPTVSQLIPSTSMKLVAILRQIEEENPDIVDNETLLNEKSYEQQIKAFNEMYEAIVYKKEDDEDIPVDEDMLVEAMLAIQKTTDESGSNNSRCSRAYQIPQTQFTCISAVVCPHGIEELQLLQNTWADKTISDEIMHFRKEAENIPAEELYDIIMECKEEEKNLPKLSPRARGFLSVFYKCSDGDSDVSLEHLPPESSIPTLTQLHKLEDFPQLFTTPVEQFIAREQKLLSSVNAMSSINHKPFQLLSKYVSSLSDTTMSPAEKQQMKEDLRMYISQMKLSSYQDVNTILKQLFGGYFQPFVEACATCGIRVDTTQLQQAFRQQKGTPYLDTLIKQLKDCSSRENSRLLKALDDSEYGLLFLAFYTYRDVRAKRGVNPFKPSRPIERRQKRREMAKRAHKVITNSMGVNGCMDYLRTKPWLEYSSDWEWYIRFGDQRKDLLQTEYAAFASPEKFAPGYYKPSDVFWRWYCSHFGPSAANSSKWNKDCSLADIYYTYLLRNGPLRLGLYNQSTHKHVEMNEKHYFLECNYMKQQTQQSLSTVIVANAELNKVILKLFTQEFARCLTNLKRKKKLILDVASESVKMAQGLLDSAIQHRWSYRQLFGTFYLVTTLANYDGANYFQTLLALSPEFRAKSLYRTTIQKMLPEVIFYSAPHEQEHKRIRSLIYRLITFKALKLASELGILPTKVANYEATISNYQSSLDTLTLSMHRNEWKNICSNKDQVKGNVVFYYNSVVDNSIRCLGFENINEIIHYNPEEQSLAELQQKFHMSETDIGFIRGMFIARDDLINTLNEITEQLSSAVPALTKTDEALIKEAYHVSQREVDPQDEERLPLLYAILSKVIVTKSLSIDVTRAAVRKLASIILTKWWTRFEEIYTLTIKHNKDWKLLLRDLTDIATKLAKQRGSQNIDLLPKEWNNIFAHRTTDIEGARLLNIKLEAETQKARNDRAALLKLLTNKYRSVFYQPLKEQLPAVDMFLNNLVDKVKLDLSLPDILLLPQTQSKQRIYNLMDMCQACKIRPYDFETVVTSNDGFVRVKVCKELACFTKIVNEVPEDIPDDQLNNGEIFTNLQHLMYPYTNDEELRKQAEQSEAPHISKWDDLLLHSIKQKNAAIAFDDDIAYDRFDVIDQLYKRLVLDTTTGGDAETDELSPSQKLQKIYESEEGQRWLQTVAEYLQSPTTNAAIPSTVAPEIPEEKLVSDQISANCPVSITDVDSYAKQEIKKNLVTIQTNPSANGLQTMFINWMKTFVARHPECKPSDYIDPNKQNDAERQQYKNAVMWLSFAAIAPSVKRWLQTSKAFPLSSLPPTELPAAVDKMLTKIVQLYVMAGIDILTDPFDAIMSKAQPNVMISRTVNNKPELQVTITQPLSDGTSQKAQGIVDFLTSQQQLYGTKVGRVGSLAPILWVAMPQATFVELERVKQKLQHLPSDTSDAVAKQLMSFPNSLTLSQVVWMSMDPKQNIMSIMKTDVSSKEMERLITKYAVNAEAIFNILKIQPQIPDVIEQRLPELAQAMYTSVSKTFSTLSNASVLVPMFEQIRADVLGRFGA